MALRNDYIPCEPLPAADVNSMANAILGNSHNILQLFLENYFAGKSTPYAALFFDGFTDTSKMDLANVVLAGDANSAQKFLSFANQAEVDEFEAGQEVIIEDTAAREINTIDAVNSPLEAGDFQVADGFTYNEVEVVAGTDADLGDSTAPFSGGASRLLQRNYSGGVNLSGDYMELTKLVSGLTIGVGVRIQWAVDMDRFGGSQNALDWALRTFDGVTQINSQIGVSGSDQTVLVDFVFVPTATSHTFGFRVISTGSNNPSQWNMHLHNLVIGAYGLTMDTNLANTYTTANSAKVSRKTVNSGGTGFDGNISIQNGNLFDHYYSLKQQFQTTMAQAILWVQRTAPDRQLMQLAMSATDTTIEVAGNQEDIYAAGDIVDLSTPDNLTRERHTLDSRTFTGSINTIVQGTNQVAAFGAKSESSSWSFTTVAGDTILIFGIHSENTGGFTLVKYNGINMTSIMTTSGASSNIVYYYLLNPPIGTFNITYFRSNSGFNHNAGWYATSYSNVSAITAYGGSGSSPQNVPTLNDKAFVYAAFTRNSAAVSLTLGTNQTSLGTTTSTNSHGAEVGEESTVTPAGTSDWVGTWTGSGFLVLRPSQSGNTELELSAGVANAWTLADFVERVSAIPEMSIVPNGNEEVLEAMTYVGTIVDFNDSPIRMEDEYSLTPTTAGEDAVMKIALDRNKTDQTINAHALGVQFIE